MMLDWITRRRLIASRQPDVPADPPKPKGRAMSGTYLLLYKYLNDRYANAVVLTFAEIEDVLGFTLPDQARLQPQWWTDVVAGPSYSDSWILASRTAVPNMVARTVLFERTS
jgi:hypothetical protein